MDKKNPGNIIAMLFFLIGVGCALQAANSIWKSTSPFPLLHPKQQHSDIAHPTQIFIPEIGLHTPIALTVSAYETKQSLSDNGAVFVRPPGTSGNAVFYGHRWNAIFGKLPKSLPGMKIYVLYSDGSKKTYSIVSTQNLNTNQHGVLKPSSVPKITLYTCTGIFDQTRFVAVGSLDSI